MFCHVHCYQCSKGCLGHMLALTLPNKSISIVPDLKILGITFANDLKWHIHHSQLCKKASNTINIVAHFGRSVNIDM